MARRTKQEADETREALLDAAEQVFLERGVARASLDEIARAAGCTRGAVHWHFRDKLGLFLALDERLVLLQDELRERLCCDPNRPPLEHMAYAISAAMDDLERDPRRKRLLTIMLRRCEYVEEMAPALERRRAADLAFRTTLREHFERAELRGELAPNWKPERAAFFFYALISGFLNEWLRGNAGFELAAEVGPAVCTFLACVAQQPAS